MGSSVKRRNHGVGLLLSLVFSVKAAVPLVLGSPLERALSLPVVLQAAEDLRAQAIEMLGTALESFQRNYGYPYCLKRPVLFSP